MKKSELILKLSSKFPSFKINDIEKIVNIFFSKITKSLSENKRIEIRGFGSFRIKENKARVARNPKTGESINVSAKKSVHFRMGKILNKRIKSQNEIIHAGIKNIPLSLDKKNAELEAGINNTKTNNY